MKCFKIYPDPRAKFYFSVKVFGSSKKFIRYAGLKHPNIKCGSEEALCVWFTDPTGWLLGEVLIPNKFYTPLTLSHEACHASLAYVRLKRKKVLGYADDEFICTTQSYLLSQLLKRKNLLRREASSSEQKADFKLAARLYDF